MRDFRNLPPFPCDSKPRLSLGGPGNVIPLPLPSRKRARRDWEPVVAWLRRLAVWVVVALALVALAMLMGCAPEPEVVEPVPVPPPVCEWPSPRCCVAPPSLEVVALRELGVRR